MNCYSSLAQWLPICRAYKLSRIERRRSSRQCNAVRFILDEHEQLSAVMHGMLHFVRQIDKGEQALVRELEYALIRYELEGSPAFPGLRDLVETYARFYFNHVHLEEKVIFPAAQRLLTPEDWAVIDAAFTVNQDPFASADLKNNLHKLILLIVTVMPSQIEP
ncbi:hemerythrin domain-containing protein [Paraherbaspirillum soli]|uniref:Hemerythrin domain-containing protein n=1 Tax=Paraherbaspirillum soli TaxID=631222 RepID=A0ABW0M8W5_9BURK